MEPLISVHIDSAEKNLWEGQARSVSSVNSQGAFDILPYHATFVTLIENQTVQIRTDKGQTLKFEFSHCVIFNRNNIVAIFSNL